MPLSLRKVEPSYVSRGTLPEKISVPNDLEAVANGTLSNVILQLSSLSHHAEEIFTDLVRVATDISTRSVNLQGRLDRLAVKVNQLDGAQEESDSMQDCLNTKPFQSSTAFDQQVVSRASMPVGMLHKHSKCDRPPPLERLNPYRDDGKDGLKFYTDPSYFFDLWRQEMLKDTEKAVRKLNKPHKNEGGRRNKKHVRQPANTRDKHKNMALQRGEHIMSTQVGSPTEGLVSPKPVDVGDGIIYPEMPKKTSRPTSMEIKHVSFDGIDGPEERTPKSEKGLEDLNHAFANHAHYHRSYSYDEYYQNYNKPIHRQISLPAYESPETKKAHDNPKYNNNPSAYAFNHNYNGNASHAKKYPASRTHHSNGRRSSESSDSSSVKINGLSYSRPTQPPPAPPTNSNAGTPSSITSGMSNGRASRTPTTRDTLPPPPPPPVDEAGQNGSGDASSNYPLPPPASQDRISQMPPPPLMEDAEEELPPPPPTPDQCHIDQSVELPKVPPGILKQPSLAEEMLPPAPPPPPPPESDLPVPPPPPPPLVDSPTKPVNGGLAGKDKRVIPPPVVDTRSELLKAIRGGISLKKVEKVITIKDEKGSTTLCDVAAILSRRVALEMSDSDSDSSEHSSDGWDETSA